MEEMARSEDYRLRVRMLNGIGFSATYFWHESPGWQAATLGARYIEKAAELGCSAMRTRVAGEILRARAEVSKGRGRDEGFANYVGLTEKALEIERARGDNIGIAYCLHGLGHAHFYQGRLRGGSPPLKRGRRALRSRRSDHEPSRYAGSHHDGGIMHGPA